MNKKLQLFAVLLLMSTTLFFACSKDDKPELPPEKVVTFTDANLKAALVANTSINTNNDNEIQEKEALAFTGKINVSGKKVTSLKDLKNFPNITALDCSNNNLVGFDITKNTKITTLNCSNNKIVKIAVQGKTKAGDTNTGVILPQNSILENLNCSNNLLELLDVSQLLQLKELDCTHNPTLNNIKVNEKQLNAIPENWKKDNNAHFSTKDGNEKEPIIYIGGSLSGKPVIWKNGVPEELSIPKKEATVKDIFVANSDVYAVGFDYTDSEVAVMWKNGEYSYIFDDKTSSHARAVFVKNNDVYIVGEKTENKKTKPFLWKNGEITLLPINTNDNGGNATDIFIYNNDIYIVGNTETGAETHYQEKPALWKNGVLTTLQNLSEELSTDIRTVFISENNIYIGGSSSGTGKCIATLWKNGTPTALTKDKTKGRVYDIFVKGNDIYAVGWQQKTTDKERIAVIWKNGTPTELSDGTLDTIAYSVYIDKNNNKYVVGYDYNNAENAVYWKNGKRTNLSPKHDIENSYSKSIFVVE